MVYTSSSLSLATLEVLVHLEDPGIFARHFSWIRVEIPDDFIEILPDSRLPRQWCADEIHASTRAIGNSWLRSLRSAVLAVPSVVTPGERNYLLNPRHPDLEQIRISPPVPFSPDPRLAH